MPQPPTRFDLRRSRTLALWLAGVHGGGALAVWGSALPATIASVLSLLAVVSLVRSLRLHALRSARNAVVWVSFHPEIRIGFPDGRECRARHRAPPLAHAWLVVLRLETDGGHLAVLVPPDSLSSRAEHKVVRGGLRHGRSP